MLDKNLEREINLYGTLDTIVTIIGIIGFAVYLIKGSTDTNLLIMTVALWLLSEIYSFRRRFAESLR
jgi:hypothetical protein